MVSIFISRPVDTEVWKLKLPAGCKVEGQSLIDIAPLAFDMPEADWIFFYSKNGVQHFFEQSSGQLANYRWAAIGPATATSLAEYVLDIDFIGDGNPQSTAHQLDKHILPHERICYVRAQQSRKSVQSYSTHQHISDVIIYENNPSADIPMGDYDVLIFTSPMNVESYLAQRSLEGSKLIAIGPTTASALQEKGYADITIPVQPTEAALLEAAVELIKSI